MNEFEEVIQKLNKKSEEYDPTLLQQQRVKNLVFSKDYSKEERRESNINLFFLNIMKLFKSKAFWAVGGMGILLIFFGTPLLFIRNIRTENSLAPIQDRMEEPMVNPMYDMNVSDGFYDETVKSGSVGQDNMERKIMPDEMYEIGDSYYHPPRDPVIEDTETPQYERAQRRDAEINITVEDFNQKYIELNNKITATGGYVLNSNTDIYDSRSSATITARVPVDQFDGFMNYLRTLGVKVNSENISITDKQNELTQVTKQIQEVQEKIDLLKGKASLTKEEELSLKNLEGQLESSHKNEEEIRQETEFSTVQIYIGTEYEYNGDEWALESTWDDVAQSVEWIFEFWVDAAMWSIVPLLFCSPILVVVGGVVWWVKRKKK